MRSFHSILVSMFIACTAMVQGTYAAGTAMTYQGRLIVSGQPANGQFDLDFRLFPSESSLTQIGDVAALENVNVQDGVFTVTLDFHAPFDAAERWLGIGVRPGDEAGAFTPLTPRQKILASPQAMFALNAPFQTNGTTVYYNDGPIGIGTSAPAAKLHVEDGQIRAVNTAATAGANAVFGSQDAALPSPLAAGVFGEATNPGLNGIGVFGFHYGHGDGVRGESLSGIAVHGRAYSLEGQGYAGYFEGGPSYFSHAVGIGTAAPAFTLHVNGTAGKPGGGSWSNSSDARLKKDIQPLRNALENLLALRGVTFEYIDPSAINELPGQRMGVIAQEVERVFPDWVETRDGGFKSVTFRGFEALTVEAMRELQSENDSLRTQLNAQQQAIASLMERLAALEANSSR